MLKETTTTTRYYFDQRVISNGFAGFGYIMDESVKTDEQAIEWAKARMKELPFLKVENIRCQTITMRPIPLP